MDESEKVVNTILEREEFKPKTFPSKAFQVLILDAYIRWLKIVGNWTETTISKDEASITFILNNSVHDVQTVVLGMMLDFFNKCHFLQVNTYEKEIDTLLSNKSISVEKRPGLLGTFLKWTEKIGRVGSDVEKDQVSTNS